MKLYLHKLSLLGLVIIIFVSLAGCAENHVAINEKSGSYSDRYEPGVGFTFEEYAKSLPERKLKVGFDIDDTLLFSSQATQLFKMQAIRMSKELTTDDEKEKFRKEIALQLCLIGFKKPYDSVYGCMDDLSMPKIIAHNLLSLHIARGDQIYIITARKSPAWSGDPNKIATDKKAISVDKKEVAKDRRAVTGDKRKITADKRPVAMDNKVVEADSDKLHMDLKVLKKDKKKLAIDEIALFVDKLAVAKSLQRAFNVEAKALPPENIFFAGSPARKHKFINKLDLDYYFGDADTDITESLNAGSETKPIRILRSPASLSGTPANPGRYGEVVLLNSEY